MSGVLALRADGKLTYCTAPEERRGMGRCNHIAHANKDESQEDFVKRIENLKAEKPQDNPYSSVGTKRFKAYRMTEEEKSELTHIRGRVDLANPDIEGGYISLETPLWSDMNKNEFSELSGMKLSEINQLLRGQSEMLTYKDPSITDRFLIVGRMYMNESNPRFKKNKKLRTVEHIKGLYGDKVKFGTGVEQLNKYAEEQDYTATKDVYVLPYYMRPDPPGEGESKHPLNSLYNNLIIKRANPNKQQEAYEQLLNNDKIENSMKGQRGFALSGLSSHFTGKGGIMRKYMSGRNIAYSGRALISPDPDQGYGEAKIPPMIAVEIFKPTITDYLIKNRGYNEYQVDKFIEQFHGNQREIDSEKAKELEDILVKADVRAVLNRQPSLHSSSYLSFKPRISPDGTIKINPLNVEGYGADFDGDQQSVYGLNTEKMRDLADRNIGAETLYGTHMPANLSKSILNPSKEAKWGLLNILSKRTN